MPCIDKHYLTLWDPVPHRCAFEWRSEHKVIMMFPSHSGDDSEDKAEEPGQNILHRPKPGFEFLSISADYLVSSTSSSAADQARVSCFIACGC